MRKVGTSAASPQALAVFVHIFKNAGTTVSAQLLKQVGPDGWRRLNDGKIDGQNLARRTHAVLAEPNVRAIVGHFSFSVMSRILAEDGRVDPVYFTFLRSPLERILSSYSYHRSNPASRLHGLAMQGDIVHYLDESLRTNPRRVRNHQCASVSADGSATFAAARATIDDAFAFVGVVDDLEATNLVARRVLGFGFDPAFRTNVSPRPEGRDAMARIVLENYGHLLDEDQKLYDYVKSRLRAQPAA
jgi:hypothetical protein